MGKATRGNYAGVVAAIVVLSIAFLVMALISSVSLLAERAEMNPRLASLSGTWTPATCLRFKRGHALLLAGFHDALHARCRDRGCSQSFCLHIQRCRSTQSRCMWGTCTQTKALLECKTGLALFSSRSCSSASLACRLFPKFVDTLRQHM